MHGTFLYKNNSIRVGLLEYTTLLLHPHRHDSVPVFHKHLKYVLDHKSTIAHTSEQDIDAGGTNKPIL